MASIEAINRQKTCRHGQMLYNIHDTVIGRSLDLYGEYCESEITLARHLDSLSYKMYRHESHYFNPGNFFGNVDNVFGSGFSVNMMCIRESVKQELTGLEPVAVGPGEAAV